MSDSGAVSYFPLRAPVLVASALAVAVLLGLGTTAAVASPAPAYAAPTVGVRTDPHARATPPTRPRAAHLTARHAARLERLRTNPEVPKRAAIVFVKNWRHQFHSRVELRVWARTGPPKARRWVRIETTSWRAGSGMEGRGGKDECRRSLGWAPDGVYSFVQHDHRRGTLINGQVFQLQAKTCRNGTLRQSLFIHTEETSDNRQCADRKGDDGCRFEVPKINDYHSWGCIKMSPTDLHALTRHFHRYFRAEVRYPTSRVWVRVTG